MTKRLLAILVPFLLASCAKSREVNAVSSGELSCTSCHGDPSRVADPLAKAAPPASTSGGNGGAHLVHLQGGVACGSCHEIPTTGAHANGVVEVTFAALAIAKGATPAWNEATRSCSGVYCHGATLGAGGSVPAPTWSGGPLDCGACHGAPPPSPHPGSTLTGCVACHADSVNADGTIKPGGLHANGSIDAAGGHGAGWSDPAQHGPAAMASLQNCRNCHGVNLDGVGGTARSCQDCHYANWQSNCTFCHGTRQATYTATPANLLLAAPPQGTHGETLASTRAVGAHQKHLSGGSLGPAVACGECHVVPTSLAHLDGTATVTFGTRASQGAHPVWNGTTCASSYCHGGTLQGGSNTAPTWTAGASQTTCGSCHGIPPPSHDAASTACNTCHGAGYSTTTVNAALHMNGALDATQQHPANWADPAQHGYAANRQGLTYCTGCHTGFEAGTTGASCNACHTTANWADWKTNCTFCHGTRVAGYTSASLTSAAPPLGTEGETASTARAVGAHQKHLTGGSIGPAVTCDTCHAIPADLTHVNGTALVTFGPDAKRGGATTPTWNGSSCASTYCHGGTGKLLGGLDPTPVWTGGSSQTTCGSCHGLPPPAPHPQNAASCGNCHTGYGAATVNTATHMNGAVDVNATCTSCHGKAGQTATAASPLNAAPPTDTTGASTGLRVGAHQAHLVAGPYANAVPCQGCHANVGTYTTSHSNGTANVGFTGAANANLQKGTYVARSGTTAASCSATWCHGAVIGRSGGTSGGTATAPSWNGSVTACTACHAVTLSALPNRHSDSKHSGLTCDVCHGAGYSSSTVNVATHVDGVKNILIVGPTARGIRSWNSTTGSCTPSCHSAKTW